MNTQAQVIALLDEMGLSYSLLEHAPVATMADSLPNARRLGAVMPKNLFLTPRSEREFFLAIVPPDAPLKTSSVSKQLGSARLSFGSEERLWEFLQTLPGAISPFGLLFDRQKRVRFAMERSLLGEISLAFHPCAPTATIAMQTPEFLRFLSLLQIEPILFDAQRP